MKNLQKRVEKWGARCFGRDHMMNKRVRALRLLEEAIEFAQSVDVPEAQSMKLLLHVYSRDKGHPSQELAGVGVGLLAACSAMSVNVKDVIWKEIERIESKTPEYFTQRNRNKIELGFK